MNGPPEIEVAHIHASAPTAAHRCDTRSHRYVAFSLLLSTLLLIAGLPTRVLAQNGVVSFDPSSVLASRADSMFGDGQVIPVAVYTRKTPTSVFGDFFITNVALGAGNGAALMSVVLPASAQSPGSAHTFHVRVDPFLVSAGTYLQDFTVTLQSGGLTEDHTVGLEVTVQAGLFVDTHRFDSVDTLFENAAAPNEMMEGTDFSVHLALRSKPTANVIVNVMANALHADIPSVSPTTGLALPGGGPLISLDRTAGDAVPVTTRTYTFTPTNWASVQAIPLYAMRDPLIQGDRWTTVDFAVSSADTAYDGNAPALANLTSQLSVTILERDSASFSAEDLSPGLSFSSEDGAIEALVVPGVTPDVHFTLVIGSQPSHDVHVSLPAKEGRYTLSPSEITFTSASFAPVLVTVLFVPSTVLFGRQLVEQNFSAAVSDDPNYSEAKLMSFRFTFEDPLNRLAALSPPFAYFEQHPSAPVILTLSWDPPATFIPATRTESALPDVSCVFGNVEGCADPGGFYGAGNAGCHFPYAQVIVPGVVVSPTQMQCGVPTCPSVLRNNAATPGMPSQLATVVDDCVGAYRVLPLISGQPSQTSLPFIYLMPLGGPDPKVPRINSITPSVIDVNAYVWITLHGSNFNSLTLYPNPTGKRAGVDAEPVVARCRIAGIVAPAADVSRTEQVAIIDPLTGNTVGWRNDPIILCLSRPRPDLAGSSDRVPVLVEVSLNGQEYTPENNEATLYLFDYDREKTNEAWTYFFVCVALVGLLFGIMILQHFLCANFFRTHKEEVEDEKVRMTRGPQMLIDLLEPVVAAGQAAVREAEKSSYAAKQAAEAQAVRTRIAEIQKEALDKREAKRAAKEARKLAKESARAADRARQEVLAAAGLAPEVEMTEAGGADKEKDKEDKKRRKKEKKEREAAESSAAAAEVDASYPPLSPGPIPSNAFASRATDDYGDDPESHYIVSGAGGLGVSEPITDAALARATAAVDSAAGGYSSERSHGSRGSSKKKKGKKSHKESDAHGVELQPLQATSLSRPDVPSLAPLRSHTGAAAAAPGASPSPGPSPSPSAFPSMSPSSRFPDGSDTDGDDAGHRSSRKKRSGGGKSGKKKKKDRGEQPQGHGHGADSEAGDDTDGEELASARKSHKKKKDDKKSSKKKRK